MNFPRSFSIAAIESDYSLFAQDMTFEVTGVAQRCNAEITLESGRKVLSGWHKGAGTKVTFHVSHPLNEEIARASVIAALREIEKTQSLIRDLVDGGEDYLLPLMTSVPVGCYWSEIRRVDRKRDRKAAFLWDFLAETRDAWNRKLQAVRALVETGVAA
jgi:hypothetical protein